MSSLFQCHLLPQTSIFFFFNDTATTEIYTLSLHDALPICGAQIERHLQPLPGVETRAAHFGERSEEHTSELQSHSDLVCRLLLEKKKKKRISRIPSTSSHRTIAAAHCINTACQAPRLTLLI